MFNNSIQMSEEDYLKYENKYKEYFEKYLLSKIPLTKYEKEIDESPLGFGKVKNPIKLKSKLSEYLNLNHFYVLNKFYINKLNNNDINILINGNENQINSLIIETYKEVLTYPNEKYKDIKTLKINYTFSTSEETYSNSDELVIAIYYGDNTKNYGTKENYLKNYNEKQLFMKNMEQRICSEIKEILKINNKIMHNKI